VSRVPRRADILIRPISDRSAFNFDRVDYDESSDMRQLYTRLTAL